MGASTAPALGASWHKEWNGLVEEIQSVLEDVVG
jgi:hypothetical protein